MKFLLDENFPLRLLRRLLDDGFEADHVIGLGLRGISDAVIRKRLLVPGTVLLTHDLEFLEVRLSRHEVVIVSRVPQALPIEVRAELWMRALREFVARKPPEQLFEILPDGRLAPWEIHDLPAGG